VVLKRKKEAGKVVGSTMSFLKKFKKNPCKWELLWHYFDSLVIILVAIPIAIYFWCEKYLDRSERCEDSPDGTHFDICRDLKNQCKWCGRIAMPRRDARGK